LKTRFGWFIIGAGVILIAAFLFDQAYTQSTKVQSANGTSITAPPESVTMRSCDLTQESYTGPLVPDQNSTSSNLSSIDIKPDEKQPISTRSKRAGFSISTPADPELWAGLLGSGWYVDWSVRPTSDLNNLEYWPMIRVHEDCISPGLEEIQSIATNNHGLVWIIGNEPDVIWQDNVTATRYAYA
jgi:hypothetical protein